MSVVAQEIEDAWGIAFLCDEELTDVFKWQILVYCEEFEGTFVLIVVFTELILVVLFLMENGSEDFGCDV